MRIIACFLILIMAFSYTGCSSADAMTNVSKDLKPLPKLGCSKYKGKDWEKCVSGLLTKLENILNTQPQKELVETKRHDSEYVLYSYKFCFGDEDFCFVDEEYKYEPTTMGKVIDFAKIFGFGFFVGIIAGVYIP
jgi:hypothetical protein